MIVRSARQKIKTLKEIVAIVKRARQRGLKVVTTNGCFDLLHVGHIRNLKKAKSLGDLLVVGVNSDASVRAYKNSSRPIVPAKERAEVLAALETVDYVFVFNERTPIGWIKKLKPNVHVKGRDRAPEEIVEKEVVEINGGRVVLVPYVKGKSTTEILKRILRKTR